MRSVKKAMSVLLAVAMILTTAVTTKLKAYAAPAESLEAFAAEFANPTDPLVMQKTRYWVPAGYPASSQELLAEIDRELEELADAGYGMIELAVVHEQISDNEWEIIAYGDGETSYRYGTSYWTETVRQVLKSAQKHGIIVDLTCGPQWPPASNRITPAHDAACKEIVWSVTELNLGDTYTALEENILYVGTTDEEDPSLENTLLGVYAAKYTGTNEISFSGWPYNDQEYTQYVLAHETLELLETDALGEYDFTAPEDNYVVIEIYERPTGQILEFNLLDDIGMSGPYQTDYVLDLFSEAGVEELTSYFEEMVFDDEIRELLREVGGNFFEDSLEMKTRGLWTAKMFDEFASCRGYELDEYLPYVLGVVEKSIDISTEYEGVFPFVTNDTDYTSIRVVGDFIQTISDLYTDKHVNGIKKWAEDNYDMGYRVQAYGLAIDSALASANATVPEGESLTFSNQYDDFRLMAAGRDMAGITILSDELGANFSYGPYGYEYDELLNNYNKNYAAGVNSVVLHGYSYMYSPEAVWPGFHAFGSWCTAPFSSRMPQWNHINDITGYVNRTQYVLQQGVQKTDVAIYSNIGNASSGPFYDDTSLTEAGYSYQFFTKGLFGLDTAVVSNGLLNEAGPGYKAMVINNEGMMPLEVIRKLQEFASNGLAIVVVGDMPVHSTYLQDSADDVTAAFRVLLGYDNVVQVSDTGQVVDALKGLGVTPDVEKASGQDDAEHLISIHRATGDGDFYFFYNKSEESVELDVWLAGSGVPLLLNAWTGEIESIAQYQTSENGVQVTIALDSNDTQMIAIANGQQLGISSTSYATESTSSAVYDKNFNLGIRLLQNGEYQLTTNVGYVYSGSIETLPEVIEINSWNLEVESWTSGDPSDARITNKDIIFNEDVDAVSWTQISGLGDNISGIGSYTTNFHLENGSELGAYLSFEEVNDTFRVYINNQLVAPCNIISKTVDLGGYLVDGDNVLTVEVATSLQNAANKALGQTKVKEYGIIGTATITPYYDMMLEDGNFKLSTDAYHVKQDEYANITTEFVEPINSNTAILN